ncbi:MAG: protease modulator HflK [Lysobacteraceae bacterium]|nr:MAG: protease modulator HflK [Xanthomonadaceae bacterium]
MAWNEPGKGDRDPWSGGGDQPPDLDEVFKRAKERLSSLFGGGGSGGSSSSGGSGSILWIVGALALGWTIIDSPYVIKEGQRGVVLRFGEHVDTMQPGFNLAWPRPISRVYRVDVSQVRSTEDQAQMLTRDENIVNLDFAIQFRVKDAYQFLFRVRDPEMTVLQASESSIRQIVGTSDMDYVLRDGRAQIAADSLQLLQDLLDFYEAGVEIVGFNLQDVRPPTQVKEAFDDAIKAREDEERYKNEAQAYANGEIPVARGHGARIRQEAEGYKASVIARAEGEAQRFDLLREQYALAPDVTRQRLFLETIESVLDGSSKVLLDVDGSGNLTYLPLDKIMSSEGRTIPSGPQRGESTTMSQSGLDSVRDSSRRQREGRG